MRQFRTLLKTLLFGLFAVTILTGPAAAADKLIIANGEWAPLFSPNLPDYGEVSRRVTATMKMAGINIEYRFAPWTRGYRESAAGKIDGAIGWPHSDARAGAHFYSKVPIEEGNWFLFHLPGTPVPDLKPASLTHLVFGVTYGDWALDGTDPLTRALQSRKLIVSQANTDQQMFQMLVNGRIDVFPQHKRVGEHQLDELVTQGRITKAWRDVVTHYKMPYRRMPLYLLLNRARPENRAMMTRFDQAWSRGAWKAN